jgi:hypothetical protein
MLNFEIQRIEWIVYTNSLMAMLNGRRSIRSAAAEETMSVSLRGIQNSSGSTAVSKVCFIPICLVEDVHEIRNAQGQTNNIAIRVETTQEFTRDNHPSDPEVRGLAECSVVC